MNLEYVLSRKTGGANPSKIFDGLSSLDQDALNYHIRQMPYADFLRTAYWFAVSMVAKSTHDPSEIHMPDGDPIVLTKELIDNCRANGSFTNATLKCFGLTRPLIAGWPSRLVGKSMTREEYREALESRYVYNSGPLPASRT